MWLKPAVNGDLPLTKDGLDPREANLTDNKKKQGNDSKYHRRWFLNENTS